MALLLPILLLISFFAPSAWAAEPPAVRPLDELLDALESPKYQTRRKAVLATKGRKEKALLERLLLMATRDPHVNIRGYVAEVLPSFKDPRIVPLLVGMAQSGEFGERHSALVALGRTRDPRAYDVLAKALTGARITRGYAAKGLGLLGDQRAFSQIVNQYEQHLDDPYLSDLGPGALVALDKQRGLDYCRERFAASSSPAIWGLVRTLGAEPTDETRKLMLDTLLGSDDPEMRTASLRVLRDVANATSVTALLDAMRAHPDQAVPIAAILGRLADKRARAPLEEGLTKARDASAKITYIAALADLRQQGSISAIKVFLADKGYSGQPRVQSSVSGFPWNSYVAEAAYWAIRTLQDGKEPFDRSKMMRFPQSRLEAARVLEIKALAKALEDDE